MANLIFHTDGGLVGLLLRLTVAIVIFPHGAQKLFGWFGGYGIAGTGGFLETLGFRPGKTFATAAGLGEFLGGLLLAFGFLGAVGPAIIIAGMIVAMVTVHWKNKFFVATNGIEHPLMYTAVAIGIALTGPGRYSLDAALGNTWLETPRITWILLAIGVVAGLLNLAVRRAPPAKV